MPRLSWVFLAALSSLAAAPDLARGPWPASWASHPEAGREFGVYHFRRSFALPAPPKSFVVHVSADNRYELFVNGARVALGPARGDLQHWRYETLDLAPHLRAGRNVLAAVVWNAARSAPGAQFTTETGFLVQGGGEAEAAVNTPAQWKCYRDPAYSPLPHQGPDTPVEALAGAGESFDGARYPWGWEQPGFDDSNWRPAVRAAGAMPRGARNDLDRWFLVPDGLPPMESSVRSLARVVRSSGAAPQFREGRLSFRVPPRSRVSVLLDNGVLTTAYPELTVSGGRGASVRLVYSESLWKRNAAGDWEKGNRNETEGKEILGGADLFRPEGGEKRLYRPLWWRCYRYLALEIETGAQELRVEDLRGRFSAYPFQENASFESRDPELARIWQVGWRTARLCAHETYMDCPYYEQMQYVGDTRIQALVSLYVSGDDRLMRNAIAQFDDSRTSEGITYSRYPSNVPQFIPTFSLLWINMLHDFWMHRQDDAFVREHLEGARTILGYFERRADVSGLAGPVSWWPYVDWVVGWSHGVPPGGETGQSAVISLQWMGALRAAAELEERLGDRFYAERYRARAERLGAAIRERCWNPGRALYADSPEQATFSQHANTLAVLEGLVPEGERAAVMGKVLDDASLIQATYYFRHYLARAANRAGLGERYLDMLGPWHAMLKAGLTTWAETPEPTRSDCHAWSSSPNFELLATVAGIEPAESGFRSVRIQPHLGRLPWLKARLPHPAGLIEVDFQRRADGSVTGTVTLPPGLSGEFVSGSRRQPLVPGRNPL